MTEPTREQVEEWRLQAKFSCHESWPYYIEGLQRMCALAYAAGAKDEREVCAQLCDYNSRKATLVQAFDSGWTYACKDNASRIRARSSE